MTAATARLWLRTGAEGAAAACLLLFAGEWARRARWPWELAVSAGAFAAAPLFAVLAGGFPRPRVSRGRLPPLALKGAFLVAGSASEEVIWRWFVLGALAELGGLGPAYVLGTAAFALAHGGAWPVHLLTGAVFGALYLATGSLAAAVAAHAAYNLLIALAVESERPP